MKIERSGGQVILHVGSVGIDESTSVELRYGVDPQGTVRRPCVCMGDEAFLELVVACLNNVGGAELAKDSYNPRAAAVLAAARRVICEADNRGAEAATG